MNELIELAHYLGIQTQYENVWGESVEAKSDTLIKIINLLGVALKTGDEAAEVLNQLVREQVNKKIEETHVLWNGKGSISLYLTKKELTASLHYEIHLEAQTSISNTITNITNKVKKIHKGGVTYYEAQIKLPQLPLGYHRVTLHVLNKQYNSALICAPVAMYTDSVMNNEKMFGLFSPIYALSDSETIGCGDLGTFSRFSKWVASQGGRVVATMPFFASFLKEQFEPSPYSPVSRLFWNELYLDLNFINTTKEYSAQSWMDTDRIIDLKKVAEFKRELIQTEIRKSVTPQEIEEKVQTYSVHNPELKSYALFRAINERAGKSWHFWPEHQRHGVLELDESLEEDYYYHLFVQWQLLKQIQTLKKQINAQGQLLYLDLPIGVHKEGFDAWYYQNEFIQKACIGAPPDAVYRNGQNWGSPPLNPITIRRNNYSYWISMLRHILPHVDILRIDHVMGLNRLYWIPEGCQPSEGAYVEYKAEEFYAILCIESHRHKTVLIGENLGTVPDVTHQMMKKHSMLPMHIIQYQLDSKTPLNPKSEQVLSSLNTHDMPTFHSYCNALDIKKNYEKHTLYEDYKTALDARNKNLNKLKNALKKSGYATTPLIKSTLQYLAQSKAQIVLINIEDLWNEPCSQNIPASTNDTNWRRRLAFSLEEIAILPEVHSIMQAVQQSRKSHSSSSQNRQGLISSDDLYLFNEGRHFRLYEHLGAHPHIQDGVEGIHFAVWAPNAERVCVTGTFNSWDKNMHCMSQVDSSGIWQLFIPEANVGDLYKFHIESRYNLYRSERSDPFAFYQEIAPKTASVVWHSDYQWNDEEWMKKRREKQNIHAPISIYEVHIGSWRRVVEEHERFLTYRELAPLLADYVLEMNFTHVEFLPIMEHPFYGSWGYQTLGYFTPSSRYGTPDDFKYLIDYLHQRDIGVILDWVPSHFPNDLHGLAYFDGTHLYEHADPKKGFHPDWKSAIFNYGRHEVKAFLISSALFWLDKYHIDGIRVDAVASMLYLDYSRGAGEWVPNEFGGNENLEAIRFLKELNELIYSYYPDVQTFAEESTAWPGVSRPTYLGGLGFGFKWDMGWMHDTLSYFRSDPIHRRYHQHQLTFRMIYAFTENFVLSLSHDEVVHGKGSLINKMPGDEWTQFANLRLLLGYMFAMPGKKLLFMGGEFGQRSEWGHEHSLDWHVLQYPLHKGIQQWVTQLNTLYKSEKALYELDHAHDGFAWIDANDSHNSVYSFIRKSSDNELILVVLNCTPVTREGYRIGVPPSKVWHLLESSEKQEYGGGGYLQSELIPHSIPFHNRQCSLLLNLPGLSVVFYKCKNEL